VDTGGHATDYVDAPNGDFRLISTAPSIGAAHRETIDCGAAQADLPSGGGGITEFSHITLG
jgi:hypothetical protein